MEPDQENGRRIRSLPNLLVVRALRKVIWRTPQLLTKLYSLWARETYPFKSVGPGLEIHYTCDLKNMELIQIGNHVSVFKDVWLQAQLSPANTLEGAGKANPAAPPVLILEDDCWIGRRAHIDARNCIHLEKGVLVSAAVLIQDYAHDTTDLTLPIREQGMTKGGKIRIGQGCWIGQGAAIICDSGELTLGRNCVVGANAVVTRSAPDYSVLSGNPARIVKQFDPVKGAWVLGSSRPLEADPTRSIQVSSMSDRKAADPAAASRCECQVPAGTQK